MNARSGFQLKLLVCGSLFVRFSARPAVAQTFTKQDAAAFDRADREARELRAVFRCARAAATARNEGELGPVDSLGNAHHCIRVENHWVAVFADIDSSLTSARRILAVDLASHSRFAGTLDTAALIALERAAVEAQRRGAGEFAAEMRRYSPLSMRFDGDSIEVWLIPASSLMGADRTLGGEKGYVFTPDGRAVIREIDFFSRFRPFVILDSGEVRIVSSEPSIPTLSELFLANALHETGRAVAILTRNKKSTLLSSPVGDVWIHEVGAK